MPDQPYDLCAVSVCNINNVDVENFSEIHSGVKDMYIPRLFGTPQPANGILTIKNLPASVLTGSEVGKALTVTCNIQMDLSLLGEINTTARMCIWAK